MSSIKLKKSSVPSKVPTTGDLDYGELAINYADGYLYYKDSANNINKFIDENGGYVVEAPTDGAIYGRQSSAWVNANPLGSEPNGFPDTSEFTLSWVNGTRTLTITPTATDFSFWSDGKKYTKTGVQTHIIPDTEGPHFIYYDETGTLTEANTFDIQIISRYCFVSEVYWDATNNEAVPDPFVETHGLMPSTTHIYLHNTQGAKYEEGLITTLAATVGSTGSLDSHAQFTVTSGTIWDEDIEHSIAAHTQTANIPVLYRDGSNWRMDDSGSFVVLKGTNRAYFNEDSGGGVWVRTEVGSNNDYVLSHLFAAGTINDAGNLFLVMGQNEYGTTSDAERGR